MNEVKTALNFFYKNVKKDNSFATGEKVIFIVKNQSDYVLDGFILEKFGYEVEIQEWDKKYYYEDMIEQVRRADVLADYVYVERDQLTETIGPDFPLRKNKDLNGIIGEASLFNDCFTIGLTAYFHYEDFNVWGKHIAAFGYDTRTVEYLVNSGVTMTVIHPDATPSGMKLGNPDMIIVFPNWKKNVNCYPIYIPVIDCGGCCVNTENRDVIKDTHLIRVLGMIGQMR